MKTPIWVRLDLLLRLRHRAEAENVGIDGGRPLRTADGTAPRPRMIETVPTGALVRSSGRLAEPEQGHVGFIRMNGPEGKIVCTVAVNDHAVREANKRRGCADLDTPIPFDLWWATISELHSTRFVDPDGREL